IDTLRTDLNAMSDAMIKDMGSSYQAIAEARSYAEAYSQPKPEQFSAIDLGDFARLVDERGAQGDITAPAQALRQVIEQARIADVFFFVGVPHGDQSVELTDIDFIYPPGSSPNADVPPWSDGANDLSETWDGTRWALSNGTETVPVLLGPAKYGTDLYGVEGV